MITLLFRHLNAIDFIAPAFDCIPESLAQDFLFRHIHPFEPPGKTMLQLVDADTCLRIDLFRASAAIMRRALPASLPSGPIQLFSLEDALARAARLLLDLDLGAPVAAKHAADNLRLVELASSSDFDAASLDHRKAAHPLQFREARALLRNLLATRRHFLTVPDYSQDAAQVLSPLYASGASPTGGRECSALLAWLLLVAANAAREHAIAAERALEARLIHDIARRLHYPFAI